jgi:hypothetical protein
MTATPEDKELYVAIWAKAVDTQMHFNEVSVKVRQFGLAFVAAALGLAVVMAARGQDTVIDVDGLRLHVSVFIVLASAASLYAVKILDLGVYHRMLRGAVTFGEDFEENYMKRIFDLEKGMTQAISHYSRHDDASVTVDGRRKVYSGKSYRSAEVKIAKFYHFSIGSLSVLAVILFLVTSGLLSQGQPSSPSVPAAGTGHLPSVTPNAK